MKSESIPTSIIGGYLGSGKTTLINHLLKSCGNTRLAILINDFGELPIDASLIETEQGRIITLSGGCICCSYGNDLSAALKELLQMNSSPEQIVIECSGVALPDAVAFSLNLFRPLSLQCILVMVDAETIKQQIDDRYIGDTIRRQLQSADFVAINKCDLLGAERIQEIKQWIEATCPDRAYLPTSHARLPADLIVDTLLGENQKRERALAVADNHLSEQHLCSANHDLSKYCSFTLTIDTAIDLQHMLAVLSQHSLLLRAKGYVRLGADCCHLVQIVGSRTHVTEVNSPPQQLLNMLSCIALSVDNTQKELTEQLQLLTC
ncbi:MAG: GTP-binding protein [Granulosicoccus sp.]|nr:GTP-binding protein [Granulosicoccus sp.]